MLITNGKSELDKLIKNQGVISKIAKPEVYDSKNYKTRNVSEFTCPAGFLQLEN